jgi:small subunit ribosomal protein S2
MADAKKGNHPIKLTKLLEAGVHFGHQAKRWNPRIAPYIWQAREGIHIFDLLKTSQALQRACEAAKQDVKEGKNILFVGTKRQAAPIVKEAAIKAGMPYIVSRWAGGALTNWKQIEKSIKRLNQLEKGLESGEFSQYTKKERVLLDRELTRLKRLFVGLKDLLKPPDALFIVDIIREQTAVKEAHAKGVKIYAIVDSNANPDEVDYPISGNDDAVRSINLLVSTFADAIAEAKTIAEKSK